jgi:GNAT superfamily N-acetyltransferase
MPLSIGDVNPPCATLIFLSSFFLKPLRRADAAPATQAASDPEVKRDGVHLMYGHHARSAVLDLHSSLAQCQPPEACADGAHRYASKSAWDHRLNDTEFALDLAATCDFDAQATLARYEAGLPLGVLIIAPPRGADLPAYASMEVIATHPDSRGVASALMEQAVNLAHIWECDGRIKLFSMTESAHPAYLALGFKAAGDGEYTLEPAVSEHWSLDKDTWRRRAKPAAGVLE